MRFFRCAFFLCAKILKIKTLLKKTAAGNDSQDMNPIIEEKVMDLELEGLTLDKESHSISLYIWIHRKETD